MNRAQRRTLHRDPTRAVPSPGKLHKMAREESIRRFQDHVKHEQELTPEGLREKLFTAFDYMRNISKLTDLEIRARIRGTKGTTVRAVDEALAAFEDWYETREQEKQEATPSEPIDPNPAA